MGKPPNSGKNPSPNERDLVLIARYKETGDNKYIGELFEHYKDLILGASIKYLKNRAEAQDATMDIFVKLLEKLQTHEVSNFRSWLYTFTRNHCLMRIRGRKGIIEEEFQAEKIEKNFMESPDFEHLDNEAQSESEVLEAAMAQLKDHQRRCIQLFYLEELSYRDVADRTGFELKKVKSYIQNGKRNLQLILSQAKNPKS